MTKQDYVKIGNAFKKAMEKLVTNECYDGFTFYNILFEIIDVFKEDNSDFDEEEFRKIIDG